MFFANFAIFLMFNCIIIHISDVDILLYSEVVLTYKILKVNRALTLSAALTIVIKKCKIPL